MPNSKLLLFLKVLDWSLARERTLFQSSNISRRHHSVERSTCYLLQVGFSEVICYGLLWETSKRWGVSLSKFKTTQSFASVHELFKKDCTRLDLVKGKLSSVYLTVVRSIFIETLTEYADNSITGLD